MNIVVNSLYINYELKGKGKLILLLHGWGDRSLGLMSLINELSRHYQVLAVDLPGFGASEVPKEAWDLDNYSDFLRQFLNKLEIEEPFAVIGHSNGGAVAIRAISLKEINPKKLVLIAASGIRDGQDIKKFIIKLLAKTGNVVTIWLPERYRRALRQSLYTTVGSDALAVPELKETFKKTVAQDVKADAATIAIPTLLIYAIEDRDVPLSVGQQYNELIKDSKLHVIAEAGHFIHLDQPEKVVKLILDYL